MSGPNGEGPASAEVAGAADQLGGAVSASRRWASLRLWSIRLRASSSSRAVRSSLWRIRSVMSSLARSARWLSRSLTRASFSLTSSTDWAERRSAAPIRSVSRSVILPISPLSRSSASTWAPFAAGQPLLDALGDLAGGLGGLADALGGERLGGGHPAVDHLGDGQHLAAHVLDRLG